MSSAPLAGSLRDALAPDSACCSVCSPSEAQSRRAVPPSCATTSAGCSRRTASSERPSANSAVMSAAAWLIVQPLPSNDTRLSAPPSTSPYIVTTSPQRGLVPLAVTAGGLLSAPRRSGAS